MTRRAALLLLMAPSGFLVPCCQLFVPDYEVGGAGPDAASDSSLADSHLEDSNLVDSVEVDSHLADSGLVDSPLPGSPFCPQLGSAAACADFDGDDASTGFTSFPDAGTAVAALDDTTYVSPPYSLRASTHDGQNSAGIYSEELSLTQVHHGETFSFQLGPNPPDEILLFTEFYDQGTSEGVGSITIDVVGGNLVLASTAIIDDASVPGDAGSASLGAPSAGWNQIDIRFDYAARLATATLTPANNFTGVSAPLPVTASSAPLSLARFNFGVIPFPGNTNQPQVLLDNVVVY